MSGKVGSECDLWIDFRLKLIVVQGSRSSCGWYKDLVRLVDGTRISFVLWTTLTMQSAGTESSSMMALDTVYPNTSPLSCLLVRSNQ